MLLIAGVLNFLPRAVQGPLAPVGLLAPQAPLEPRLPVRLAGLAAHSPARQASPKATMPVSCWACLQAQAGPTLLLALLPALPGPALLAKVPVRPVL